jgi:diguanylate cyclase (GGDEF)-like protein
MFYDQFEIALITQKKFVLVMCDLDNFKKTNDVHGHSEGDSVLRLFAKTLRDKLRSSDLIFRYGGDEFIIILPASLQKNVKSIFREISELFKQTQAESSKMNYDVTMSAGVLEIEPEKSALSQHELFKEYLELVDSRLYLAKNSGRNRIE